MVTFHSPFRQTDPVHYCINRSGPRHTHERPIHRSWTTRFRSHVTTTHFSAIKELKNKPVHAVWTRYVSFSSHLGSDGLTAVCRYDVRGSPWYSVVSISVAAPSGLPGVFVVRWKCAMERLGRSNTLILINGPLCTSEWAIIRGSAHSFITVTEKRHGLCCKTVPNQQHCTLHHHPTSSSQKKSGARLRRNRSD